MANTLPDDDIHCISSALSKSDPALNDLSYLHKKVH